jgi:hypothetical protein
MSAHNSHTPEKVRYAVVGLGYIVQAAVLPAFANAKQNSELRPLVSSDKSQALSDQGLKSLNWSTPKVRQASA